MESNENVLKRNNGMKISKTIKVKMNFSTVEHVFTNAIIYLLREMTNGQQYWQNLIH